MRFFKAYFPKNEKQKSATIRGALHSSGLIIIPDELLLSRARFRLLMSKLKLNPDLYIYNLS